MPTGKTDSPQKAFEIVCVYVCVYASVNPFCQVLAQSFLSKLPAGTWSPLCWWEELEEKACGTPAAPRPGPGPSAREKPGPGIWCAPGLCVAAVSDASIASPRDAPAQPCIPFHTSETGGGKRQLHTYSATSLPSLSAILHHWCTAYENTFAKFLVFCK